MNDPLHRLLGALLVLLSLFLLFYLDVGKLGSFGLGIGLGAGALYLIMGRDAFTNRFTNRWLTRLLSRK